MSLILLLVFSERVCAAGKLTIGVSSQREISLVVDSTFHSDFGLAYPVTHKIGIPPGQHNLMAFTRHSATGTWETLPEKTPTDFFNGVEAVRFDYANGIAYVSAAFDSGSGLVMIRIADNASQPIQISYQGMCLYYDNRSAAVVVSLDDWKTETLPDFQRAISLFRSYHLPMTIGIITGGVKDNETWQEMQNQINLGDIEPAAHTRTHPRWPNYGDVTSEIAGSKTDLLDSLTFPLQYRKGSRQYVYSWIAPFGETSSTLEAAVTSAKYLNDRLVGGATGGFKTWDPARKRYNSDGTLKEMGLPWGSTSQTELDAVFNAMLTGGKIYHLLCHPNAMTVNGQWDQAYVSGHLATISNRKNVWYTTFGHLYLYHLLPDPATGTTVVLDAPAAITLNPADQTVSVGETAMFTVGASSSGTLFYQWQKNGVNIGGATSSSCTTPPAEQSDEGAAFRSIVSNAVGSDTSNSAILHLQPPQPPTITANPANSTVYLGQTTLFAVSIAGTKPLTCQWQKDGTNIPGAADSNYVTPATTKADSGSGFRCIVSNTVGRDTSTAAHLSVTQPPAGIVSDDFNTLPLNSAIWTFVDPQGDVALSLVGTGTPDARVSLHIPTGISHDAYTSGIMAPHLVQNIPNIDFEVEAKFDAAMTAEYQMQGILVQQNAGHFIRCDFVREKGTLQFFSAIIENGAVSVKTDVAVVLAPPFYVRFKRTADTWTASFSGDGVSWIHGVTFSHTMEVAKIGPWAGNAGIANPDFTGLIDYFFNTSFPIVPEDGHGSTAAALVTQEPSDQSVVEGETAAFAVRASGTAPIAYQWQKNTVDVSGATGTTYTTPATSRTDSGAHFRCIVSNAIGRDTSVSALLRMNSVTYPTILIQPRGITEIEGQVAQFTVAAGGTRPCIYQWQKNSVSISGAVDSVYTTPAVALSDSGAMYRVIVTNAGGRDTSKAAMLSVYQAHPPAIAPYRIVLLGSSTAEGAAASQPDSSWARKFAHYVQSEYPACEFHNLAVGGFRTFNIMQTGFVPPDPWNTPDYQPVSGHNITRALELNPDLILVNLPSNDCNESIPIARQVANYDTILTYAASRGIQIYFTTSQPRSGDQAERTLLMQLRDQTNDRYGERAIDFWTGLADSNGDILPAYNADNTHLNNAGHAILFERMKNTVRIANLMVKPHVTLHPDSLTVTAGQSVQFSVAATGTNPLGYQWQKDCDSISGATDSIYTTPKAMQADSGALFRCIVSNLAGSDTSGSGLLCVNTVLPSPHVSVAVKVYLQGPMSGGEMNTDLLNAGVIPKAQPYSAAPWHYAGTDTVSVVPAGVVDWVLIELRADTASTTKTAARAGFIKSNGTVVDLDGTSAVAFPAVVSGDYFVVVRHRNHLAAMTSCTLTLGGNSALYDFSTAVTKAYGADAMKGLGAGNTAPFALYGGDANADGLVTSTDFNVFNPKFTSAATGYEGADLNLDRLVTSTDFNLFNLNYNGAKATRVP
jgi:lysophospholipase L1-like esterase